MKVFYTDNSWLDIKSKTLVVMDEQSVTITKFGDEHIKRITQVFQANTSHEKLAVLFEKTDATKILFSEITFVSSRHDHRIILVKAGETKSAEIEFLNVGTKAHAMERLEQLLPATLNRTKLHRSRLRSAMPRLAILGIAGVICTFLQDPGAWTIVGFLALVLVVPDLVRRLLSPTVITEYTAAEVEDEQVAQDIDDTRIAA